MNVSTRPARRRSRIVFAVLVAIVLVTAGGIAVMQRHEAAVLNAERELALMELRESERLRAANEKLRAARVSPEEVQALRADRAALSRLQAELDTLSRTATP